MLIGSIDGLSRERTNGWVRDMAYPDASLVVLVTAQGRLLGRAVANTLRPDLAAVGIGSGTFGFDIVFNPPLNPARSWLVHLRAEADGTELPGSPIRLPAAREFDGSARRALSAALDAFASDAELDDRIEFLATERDRLLRRRADRRSLRADRHLTSGRLNPELRPRALVIDHQVPRPDHDGGSSAIVSHMRALRRIGYQVVFAAQPMLGGTAMQALEREGIECCHAPWYSSVEEVLRRDANTFDLVYLHRVSIAAAYATLVRQTQPRARLVYALADLHHLRLLRQATFEDRPELLAEAERVRAAERSAAELADVVITHSSAEADILRPALPPGKVHVVTWSMPVSARRPPFSERAGLALLGHFAHPPNAAAAWALRDEILPALQRHDPSITCTLVGDGLPPALQTPQPGLNYAGHVASLDDLFDSVRLTVAPVPFGAGIKGKVLASLCAGVPCVCSPMAAEGIDLPPRLSDLVVPDADAAVRLILRLHNDEAYNTRLSKRCIAFAERAFSERALDTALRSALSPT